MRRYIIVSRLAAPPLFLSWAIATACASDSAKSEDHPDAGPSLWGNGGAGGSTKAPGKGGAAPDQPNTGGGASVASGGTTASGSGGGSSVPGTGGAAAGGSGGNVPWDSGVVLPEGGSVVTPQDGYLHTRGSRIVDARGNEVRITAINWFGLETANYAPHGLWSRSMGALLDQVKTLGYNALRVPFSSQLFDSGSVPNGIDLSLNADLAGKSGLEVMDALIEKAGARGLKVILDRHRPDSGGQSELWYTSAYSEQRWIDDWKMLADRYLGNDTVVGFDLHNEPHGPATWGDGNAATDFRAAAERAGNAILAVNPQLLIIVEGVETHGGHGYWWGGNLRGARTHPVHLSVANRLVYSTHDYPKSVHAQPWFDAADYPNNLARLWDETWGYLVKSNTAPVWLGEFGTRYETDSDRAWLAALADYIDDNDLSFAFWCLNPNSGDTGGILNDDWTTVHSGKQNILSPLLFPLLP